MPCKDISLSLSGYNSYVKVLCILLRQYCKFMHNNTIFQHVVDIFESTWYWMTQEHMKRYIKVYSLYTSHSKDLMTDSLVVVKFALKRKTTKLFCFYSEISSAGNERASKVTASPLNGKIKWRGLVRFQNKLSVEVKDWKTNYRL